MILSPTGNLTLEAAQHALPALHAWMRADAAYSAALAPPAEAIIDSLLERARDICPTHCVLLMDDLDLAREHVRGRYASHREKVLAADLLRTQAKNWLHHAGVNIYRPDHHDRLVEAAESEPDGGAAVAAFLASWMDYLIET